MNSTLPTAGTFFSANPITSISFVIICYDSIIEIHLLCLCIYSFHKVDLDFIEEIIIFYNEPGVSCEVCQKIYQEVSAHCSAELLSKVVIRTWNDVLSSSLQPPSNWYSQQAAKLYASHLVRSSVYVVMDAKNHFIRNVNAEYFFASSGRPYLDLFNHGISMLPFYDSCSEYFSRIISAPSIVFTDSLRPTAATPFTFLTSEVRRMIELIYDDQGADLYAFMQGEPGYTEFFLYACYLNCSGRLLDVHEISSPGILRMTAFDSADPEYCQYNSVQSRIADALLNYSVKSFGLHRRLVGYLNDNDKKLLKDFYFIFYSDDRIEHLLDTIFSSSLASWEFPDLPIDFSPQAYRSRYLDLKDFDDREIKHHYLNHGILEGRSYLGAPQ